MNTKNLIIPDWPAPKHIQACTTTRQGGVSSSPYDAFNLATHVEDNPEDVLANRKALQQQLALKTEPFWLNQQHTALVVGAQHVQHEPPVADASFTNNDQDVLAIMTADCLPIILTDEKGEHIAAIHAGWRSMAQNIIANTIECMATSSPIMAWLGPCIHANRYEVGLEVKSAFMDLDKNCITGFHPHPSDSNKCFADLVALGRFFLKKAGVSQIYGGNHCTYSENDFYSYRRDGKTGRMATLIWKNAGKG